VGENHATSDRAATVEASDNMVSDVAVALACYSNEELHAVLAYELEQRPTDGDYDPEATYEEGWLR
jgi:hypothetical protein